MPCEQSVMAPAEVGLLAAEVREQDEKSRVMIEFIDRDFYGPRTQQALLYYFLGAPEKDIAGLMGITPGSVGDVLRKARGKVRDEVLRSQGSFNEKDLTEEGRFFKGPFEVLLALEDLGVLRMTPLCEDFPSPATDIPDFVRKLLGVAGCGLSFKKVELEAIYYSLLGFSNGEMAEILRIEDWRVSHAMAGALRKLGEFVGLDGPIRRAELWSFFLWNFVWQRDKDRVRILYFDENGEQAEDVREAEVIGIACLGC